MKKLMYRCYTYLLLISFISVCPATILQAAPMKGMYSYLADAAWFLDCDQQKRFPVAPEGDNAALQQAYLKNRYLAGKSLLVELDGYINMRPKMEGDGDQPSLIVDQFIALKQQENCTGIIPPVPLNNTYWKLVELEGRHLDNNPLWLEAQQQGGANEREIHIKITAQAEQLKGFGGCNAFTGVVKRTRLTNSRNDNLNNSLDNNSGDNGDIKIGPFRNTRKTCPNIKLEARFLQLLESAEHYKIKGESLELFHQQQSIAKFIAIYF